jgi:hypothetical protein
MEEAGGSLHDFPDLEHWKAAVETMARTQLECRTSTRELLALGAVDQRFSQLIARVDEFFEAVGELMRLQPMSPPPVLTGEELHDTATAVKEACSHLGSLGVPDTVLHGDISPGSVLMSGNSCVITDWCEAYVGFPFLTFEHMRAHLESRVPGSKDWHDPLREAYRAPWSSVIARSKLDQIFPALPLVAIFAHAIGRDAWRDRDHRIQPAAAKYYRSLARRMFREAHALDQERIAR